MSLPTISVENLSKAYRIGLKDTMHDTLVGAVKGMLRSPLKNWRRLSRLDTFRHNGDAEDIFWALKDVSFEVQEGEVLGIIGRNGAGKSTLLKILSRITEPTSGRAVIRGRVSSLLEVGTGFHPELTGRENIYMNGTILGMTKREIDRKLDAIIDFSGVEHFLDTPVKRYSSGMKVRLAFAVAAHLDPEILIIDEVLAVGDAAFQRKCMGKMRDAASGGRTVLFVSHNLSAVAQLCDRGLYLECGRIACAGGIEDALASYTNPEQGCIYRRVDKTQPVYISEVYVTSLNPNRAEAFVSRGHPLHVCMTVNNSGDPFIAAFGVSIESSSMVRIIASNTLHDNRPSECRTGTTTAIFELEEIPLNQGNYFITVAVHDRSNGKVIDRIDQCVCFSVVEPPAHSNGPVRRRSDGLIICESAKWKSLERPRAVAL